MSKITVKADIGESTPITISLTMPLAYWRSARAQLQGASNKYESGQIMSAILVAIDKADAEYSVPTEKILP